MSQPEFSFDIYPDVDAELAAAYRRNVDGGTASPDAVANSALAAVVEGQMQNVDPLANANIPPEFNQYVTEALNATKDLYDVLRLPESIPEIDSHEFSGVDWQKLANTHEAMQKWGLEPELVVSHTGEQLEFWKTLYSKLPNTKNGGLYVDSKVEASWSDIDSPSQASWMVSVLATTPKPTITNITHDLSNLKDRLPALKGIYDDKLGIGDDLAVRDSYPTFSEYLTLQALRLKANKAPIDPETYTWLHGTFDNDSKAPYGLWYSDAGQVIVRWVGTDGQNDLLGVRPAVRGQYFER